MFSNHDNVSQTSITLDELRDAIEQYLETRHITVGQFENEVGWEVQSALAAPAEFLKLNLTGLKDLCSKVGMNWLYVLLPLRYNSNNQADRIRGFCDGNDNPTAFNGISLSVHSENRLTSQGNVLTADIEAMEFAVESKRPRRQLTFL